MPRKSNSRPQDARKGIDAGNGWILYPLEEGENAASAPSGEKEPEAALASPSTCAQQSADSPRNNGSGECSSRFPDPMTVFANEPMFRVRVYAPKDLQRPQPLHISEPLADAQVKTEIASEQARMKNPGDKAATATPSTALPPPSREKTRVSFQADEKASKIGTSRKKPAAPLTFSAISLTLQNQPFIRDELELLTHLLIYAPLQTDVHSLATRLLNTYGSLRNVMDMLPEQLARFPDLGVEGARLIALMRPLLSCYLKPTSPQTIQTQKQIVQQCMLLSGYRTEVIYAIALSASLEVVGQQIIALGSLCEVQTSPRQVAEVAISCNAPYIILCHNHPGGRCDPSDADLQATRRLQKLLSDMEIVLLDHVIVAPDGHYSLLQHGLLTIPSQLLHSYLDNEPDLEQI